MNDVRFSKLAVEPVKDSIYIAPSRGFVVIASGFYVSMAVALFLAPVPWWLAVPIFAVMLMDYIFILRMHGLRSHPKAVAILSADCNKWQYQLRSGKCYLGTLVKSKSFCSNIVIILYLQHLTYGRYIIIPRDAISKQYFRLLAFKFNC